MYEGKWHTERKEDPNLSLEDASTQGVSAQTVFFFALQMKTVLMITLFNAP